jgi:hypothetical protein
VVDYAGVPKAGYHYARRAFAPVIASFCQGADGELQLWICNSSAAPVACDAEVTLAGFSAAPDLVATVTAEVAPAQAGFNYFVRIPTPSPYVRFSDNYLDLRDGDHAEIAVRGLTDDIGDDQLRAFRVCAERWRHSRAPEFASAVSRNTPHEALPG